MGAFLSISKYQGPELATEEEALQALQESLATLKREPGPLRGERIWAILTAQLCQQCSEYHFKVNYRYEGRQKGLRLPEFTSYDSYPSRAHAVLEGHTRFMRFTRKADHGYTPQGLYWDKEFVVTGGKLDDVEVLGGVRYWSDEFAATNPQIPMFPTEYVFTGEKDPALTIKPKLQIL